MENEQERTVTRTIRITPALSEAGRKNIAGVNARRKVEGITEEHRAKIKAAWAARPVLACDCGQDAHRYTCPVYQREAQRRSRAKKT